MTSPVLDWPRSILVPPVFCGIPKLGWFIALKTSQRNLARMFSPRSKLFPSDRSMFKKFGPRPWFRAIALPGNVF